jgi:Tfp pilus assembly PilM family ATPase
VSQVFISGGSARSQFILEMLQTELMVLCRGWNPVGFLQFELSPQQMGEVEQVAPQLGVAAGAAVACF